MNDAHPGFYRYFRVVNALAPAAGPSALLVGRDMLPLKSARPAARLRRGDAFDVDHAAVIGDELQAQGEEVGEWIARAIAPGLPEDARPWGSSTAWKPGRLPRPHDSAGGGPTHFVGAIPGVAWSTVDAAYEVTPLAEDLRIVASYSGTAPPAYVLELLLELYPGALLDVGRLCSECAGGQRARVGLERSLVQCITCQGVGVHSSARYPRS